MKNFFQKYKHAWVSIYALLYLPWFYYLEQTITQHYSLIQTSFDKKIPFIEFFIVPYLLWFAFVATTVIYFFLKDRSDFYRLFLFLIIGMTAFLIISTVYPNGQTLRPTTFARDNIFVEMVKNLYKTDTPTNIFPSIHVYNTLGACIAIFKNDVLRKIKWVQIVNFTLSLSIILSTIFLKQHSILDMVGAFAIGIPAYWLAYRVLHFQKQNT